MFPPFFCVVFLKRNTDCLPTGNKRWMFCYRSCRRRRKRRGRRTASHHRWGTRTTSCWTSWRGAEREPREKSATWLTLILARFSGEAWGDGGGVYVGVWLSSDRSPLVSCWLSEGGGEGGMEVRREGLPPTCSGSSFQLACLVTLYILCFFVCVCWRCYEDGLEETLGTSNERLHSAMLRVGVALLSRPQCCQLIPDRRAFTPCLALTTVVPFRPSLLWPLLRAGALDPEGRSTSRPCSPSVCGDMWTSTLLEFPISLTSA